MEPIIKVSNSYKSYEGKLVILDLNMNVPKSCIYSLLGASGCGKTTLLNCIVGIISLDHGTISVGVDSRLKIGYMPQELALYPDLMVSETLTFFRILYGLSESVASESFKKLTEILELPTRDLRVSKLSGGQQRRLSLIMAVLTDPDILIVDEPTVGIDSILRDKIWKYFYTLTKDGGKTIVITTHYIEEARKSDIVAFMRDGKLLAEDEPQNVINSCRVPSLEEAFLVLSERQDTKKAIVTEQPKIHHKKTEIQYSAGSIDDSDQVKWRRIKAFLVKTFFWVKGSKWVVYSFQVLPALVLLAFLLALQKPTGLKVGFLNMETECIVKSNASCQTSLSCRYLNNLQQSSIRMVEYTEEDSLINAVKKNYVWAGVKINSNFSIIIKEIMNYFTFEGSYELFHNPTVFPDEDPLTVWIDMSDYIISQNIRRDIYETFSKILQEWYTDCGWNEKSIKPIVRFEKPLFGQMDTQGLSSSLIPGLVAILPYTVSTALAMALLSTERDLKAISRCGAVGLNMLELLISQFIVVLYLIIPQCIIMIIIYVIYITDFYNNLTWAILTTLLQSINGAFIGFLVALLVKSTKGGLFLVAGYNTMLSFIAGLLWPFEGMHRITQVLTWVLPTAIAGHSMRSMAKQGHSIDNPSVYLPLIQSLIWTILLTITISVYSKRNKTVVAI